MLLKLLCNLAIDARSTVLLLVSSYVERIHLAMIVVGWWGCLVFGGGAICGHSCWSWKCVLWSLARSAGPCDYTAVLRCRSCSNAFLLWQVAFSPVAPLVGASVNSDFHGSLYVVMECVFVWLLFVTVASVTVTVMATIMRTYIFLIAHIVIWLILPVVYACLKD